MARAVSLAEMRTRARQLADVEGDPNITDAELTALVNRHLPAVYDELVDAGPPDYYAATTTVTTVAGQIEYVLPSDFRSLEGVYVNESTSDRRPIPAMPTNARGRFKQPTGAWTLTLEYLPSAPTLDDDTDTFDGVSGFEELIVNMVARDVMAKRESDPSIVMANIAALQGRIVSKGRKRDRWSPKQVVDSDEQFSSPIPWGWANISRIACYRLRAGNIELYESLWGLP